MKQFICLLLILPGFILFIFSCNKKEDIKCCIENLNEVRKPPKIVVVADDYVSSLFPHTYLKCLQIDNTDFGPQVKNWTLQWTCTAKPAGAKDPVIVNQGNVETEVNNLEMGHYSFQAEIRNEKGVSKNSVDLNVIEDNMSGKTLEYEKPEWSIWCLECGYRGEGDPLGGPPIKPQCIGAIIKNKPQSFFRSLKDMEVIIEPGFSGFGNNINYTITRKDYQTLLILTRGDEKSIAKFDSVGAKVSIRYR